MISVDKLSDQMRGYMYVLFKCSVCPIPESSFFRDVLRGLLKNKLHSRFRTNQKPETSLGISHASAPFLAGALRRLSI
jgi:hypothetical protein